MLIVHKCLFLKTDSIQFSSSLSEIVTIFDSLKGREIKGENVNVSLKSLVCKLTIGSLQRGESSKLGALIVTLDDEGDYQQFSLNLFFTKLTWKTSQAQNISKVSDYLILTN